MPQNIPDCVFRQPRRNAEWCRVRTYVFAELNHPPRAVEGLVRDLVGLELQRLQLRQWGAVVARAAVDRHLSGPPEEEEEEKL